MSVACIDPQSEPLWQRLVDQHQDSVFHSSGWMRVLTETYGLEVGVRLVLDGAGDPRAGLSFCRIADMMGERLVTLPSSRIWSPDGELAPTHPQDWGPD